MGMYLCMLVGSRGLGEHFFNTLGTHETVFNQNMCVTFIYGNMVTEVLAKPSSYVTWLHTDEGRNSTKCSAFIPTLGFN